MTEVAEYADLNYSQVEAEGSSSESENENEQVPGKKRACWTNDEVRPRCEWSGHFKFFMRVCAAMRCLSCAS